MQNTNHPVTAHPQIKQTTVRYLWQLMRLGGITLSDLERGETRTPERYDGLKRAAGAWKHINIDALAHQNAMRDELEPSHG
ncbi:MAG: hypothetical protein AB1352_03460 [Patescibacteria group bacterium]